MSIKPRRKVPALDLPLAGGGGFDLASRRAAAWHD
jgi:hypothetical protein